MNSKIRLAMAAIVAAGMPLAASAASVYGGVGVGASNYKSSKFLDCDNTCLGGTFSDSEVAYNLFVGYSFTDAVAVEIAYQDWGNLKDDAFGLTDVKLEPTMWTVMAVGTAPIAGDFSAFGKAGIAFSSVDGAEGSGVTKTSQTQHAQDLALGGGIEWNLGKFGAVRVETLWVDVEDADKAMSYGASYLYRFKL